MEQQFVELLEKVNALVGQTGGEAARLWPTLVAHFYLLTIVKISVAGVLVVVAGTVSGITARLAIGAAEYSDMKDSCTAASIVTGGLVLLFLGLMAAQIPSLVYPEAAYVKSIIAQL